MLNIIMNLLFRAFDDIRKLEMEVAADMDWNYTKNRTETIIKHLTPTNNHLDDLKVVLLFKISTLKKRFPPGIQLYMFIDAVKPYVQRTMMKKNQIENFADILTFVFSRTR